MCSHLPLALVLHVAAQAGGPTTFPSGDPEPLTSDPALVAAANVGVVDLPASVAPRTWDVPHAAYDEVNVAPAPDGERLAFVRDRPAVLSMVTGDVVAELADGGGCYQPTWSGDGRTILVWCARAGTEGPRRYWGAGVDPDGYDVVLWDVGTGVRRVVGPLQADTRSVAWVEPHGAWWATAVGRPGVLGTWIGLDGGIVDEPWPAGVPAPGDRRHEVAWSPDGRRAWYQIRTRDRHEVLVALAWIDRHLVAGAAVTLDGGNFTLRVQPLDDGRVWYGGTIGPRRLLDAAGQVLWIDPNDPAVGAREEPVDPVSKAVFLATGRCPAVERRPIINYAERRSSPDGSWVVRERYVDVVLDGGSRTLPGASSAYPATTHAEVAPGVWLVTLHRTPALLDVDAGRVTWALGGTRVLAAEGSSALLATEVDRSYREGGNPDATTPTTLLRVDFARGLVWRSATAGVLPDGDAAWVRDQEGTLRRVRPDGTVTHEIPSPGRPVDLEPWGTWYGWTGWRTESGWVATFDRDPSRVEVVGPDTPPLGFAELGFGRPVLGWLDVDGPHVLDDQGAIRILPWSEADRTVGYKALRSRNRVRPTGSWEVVRWLRRIRTHRLSANGRLWQDRPGGPVVDLRLSSRTRWTQLTWPAPVPIETRYEPGALLTLLTGRPLYTGDGPQPRAFRGTDHREGGHALASNERRIGTHEVHPGPPGGRPVGVLHRGLSSSRGQPPDWVQVEEALRGGGRRRAE